MLFLANGVLIVEQDFWTAPLRVDNELSNSNSWGEVHEKVPAAF